MKLIVLLVVVATATAVEFEISNQGVDTIWVGILGNPEKALLENGGFALNGGETKTVTSDDAWAGRFWARTGCNDNVCETGTCGNGVECNGNGGVPPATVVEITLRGDGGKDFYDVSLVDGFNVKASIKPVNGNGECAESNCETDVNSVCYEQLKQKNDNGEVVGCKSSCTEYNTDQYCCRGAYNTVDTCITSNWEVNSANLFKENCQLAYSYAFNDKEATFTCIADKYIITFN